jgi:ethanolamine transporter EutH
MAGGLVGALAGGLIGGASGVLLAYPQLDELGLTTEEERQEYLASSGIVVGVIGAVIGGIIGGTIGSFSDAAPNGPAASPSALWAYQDASATDWE